MTTFNTGNPIGSTDARDLSDNAENFDTALGTTAATWIDRLGVTRDSFEGRLAKGSFYRVGDFTTGYTLTNMRQTLEYSGHEYSWAGAFPKVVAAGSTPETTGGIGAGAWVDRTDVTLRGELGGATGASLIYDLADEAGSSAQTVHSKLKTVGSVEEFGYAGQVVNQEDTSSAKEKLNARRKLYRDKANYHGPNIGIKLWKKTFGSFDTAATAAIISGTSSEPSVDVLGFTSDSQLASYPDRDQVGLFGKTDAQNPEVTTANTTFTSSSVTSADFASAIASGNICYGMYIDTNESPKKSAKITAINSGTNTLTVSGWYVVGGGGAVSTPSNGSVVYVNPVTKIWGVNWNVGISSTALATDGFGFELGTFSNKADGQLSGFYATNLGAYKAKNAFWALGTTANYQVGFAAQKCDAGSYVDSTVGIGHLANGSDQAFIARGATSYSFKVENESSSLLSGKDGVGNDVKRKAKYTVYRNGQTIDEVSVVATVAAITSGITINMPPPTGLNVARELYLKNPSASTASIFFAGNVEDGTGSFIVTAGKCVHCISDGIKWIPL